MANTPSAIKRNRQAQKRRARNTQVRTSVKNAVKKVREALASGDGAAAKAALPAAEKALATASSKGIFHRNAVSRRISRLAKAAAKPPKAEAKA